MQDQPEPERAKTFYPISEHPDTAELDLAEVKLLLSRLFEQSTWMCQVVAGVLNTLPPPMRADILKGMSGAETQENSHG
jgi:hypothetical protein